MEAPRAYQNGETFSGRLEEGNSTGLSIGTPKSLHPTQPRHARPGLCEASGHNSHGEAERHCQPHAEVPVMVPVGRLPLLATSSDALVTSSFLLLAAMHLASSSSWPLVVVPLLLVAMHL